MSSETPLEHVESEADKLHARGLELARAGRFDEAANLFRLTVELDKTRAAAVRHLAQALSDAGRASEAEGVWKEYVSLCPDDAEGFKHLGNLQKRLEKTEQAIASLQQAVKLDGRSHHLQIDLGVVFAHAKRWNEAKAAFHRALELDPSHYDALINLGMLLQQTGEGEQAVITLQKAIALRPDDPSGHNNLGVALSEQGKEAEAVACFESLLGKWPDYFLAWNNLGNALRGLGRNNEALAALRKAIDLKPDYAEAFNNSGIVHAQLCEYRKAIESYNRALLLRPDYPEAHANRGLTYLLLGDFQKGWSDYEWRWHGGHGLKRRQYGGRLWDGSPLAGKTILLYYEQGLGDTFQFIRYAAELKARGATVVFECQPNMREILSRTPGIDSFVIRSEKLPSCDFYAPLLSLPGLCQTHIDNLPRRVPYIFPDPTIAWDWKQRMAELEGFKIGIAWQGNPGHKGDRYRSISLECFAAIAQVPGVQLVVLQKNFGAEQIEKCRDLVPMVDFKGVAEDVDAWQRTASIIANLDLVITADTSVAHLAGAMGIPVWVAIPASPDWRWLVDRETTPWYPTMQLFRQEVLREWKPVFEAIKHALLERVSNWSGSLPSDSLNRHEANRLLHGAGECISQNRNKEAEEMLLKALSMDSTSSAIHQDLGVVYAKQNRLVEAIRSFRRALELSPDCPGVLSNLGLACFHAGKLEEAISHFRKAQWLGTASADIHKSLGRALLEASEAAAAEECFWAALRLKPDDVDAHYQLSRALLLQGKFEQGWLEFEWRLRKPQAARLRTGQPRWTGQDLGGKRLLVLAEQDQCDAVMFARYIDVISAQAKQIVIQSDPATAELLKGCRGVDKVVDTSESTPPHDFHIPLLSCPATLGTTLADLPASRPYIGVSGEKLTMWRGVCPSSGAKQIAVAFDDDEPFSKEVIHFLLPAIKKWADSAGMKVLRLRCVREETRRATVKSTSLVDIADLPHFPAKIPDQLAWNSAAIRGCDLVIATDNVLAHVAGAMGIGVWTILPYAAHERWMLHRSDSPWYPTMRLFRKLRHENWDDIAMRLLNSLDIIKKDSKPGEH